jgi:bleomycin hydrolase
MNRLLITMLRRKAMELRSSYEKGIKIEEIREKKDQMLGELYKFFCIFFGEPPMSFDYEYKDKDKAFHALRNVSPLEFYDRFVGIDLNEYVSIINAPTKDKPFGKTFTVRFLGNVRGGKDVMYYNTDIKTMKALAISQLKDKKPVWFGCDVGKMLDRDLGINDAELFRYDLALGIESKLTKAQRLDFRESCMTHAMVFQGVNLINEESNRWKVENSWGDEKGDKGYFIMSDSWFDEYMYQVVVHKKYLTPEIIAGLEQKPIELDPWDPMGSLA